MMIILSHSKCSVECYNYITYHRKRHETEAPQFKIISIHSSERKIPLSVWEIYRMFKYRKKEQFPPLDFGILSFPLLPSNSHATAH